MGHREVRDGEELSIRSVVMRIYHLHKWVGHFSRDKVGMEELVKKYLP